MKKYRFVVLCLTLMLAIGNTALALDPQADLQVDPPGYMEFMLPEGVNIQPGQAYDEYILSWNELAGVHAYHIGVFRVLIGELEKEECLDLANGWYGPAEITSGFGTTYPVPFTVQEGLVVGGDATEVDLGELITSMGPAPEAAHKMRVDGYYCFIMVVPENGEPVTQLVKLP